MSLSIDSQYATFVRFAEEQLKNGKADAIARGDGRKIEVARTGDKVAVMSRSALDRKGNDDTRTAFKDLISTMFNGKIPESVLKAMKYDKDFGKGKPLTARRIMAVRKEVDRFMAKPEFSTNAQYEKFVQFAKQQLQCGNANAIARGDGGSVVPANTGDEVAAMSRSDRDKQANDETRTLFRDSIAAMFGGEIPTSVKKVMKFDTDFDRGKPLTAHRIMAVMEEVNRCMPKLMDSNNAIIDCLTHGEGLYEGLPKGLRELLDRQVVDLRARFGGALVPKDAKILDIIEKARVRQPLDALCRAANESGRRIDLDEVANVIAPLAEECLVNRSIESKIRASITQKGSDPQKSISPEMDFDLLVSGELFGKRHPDVVAEIRASRTPEDIAGVLQRNEQAIRAFVTDLRDANAAVKDVAANATTMLAERLDLDPCLVAAHCPMSYLSDKARDLVYSIAAGAAEGQKDRGFSVKGAYEDLVNRFVDERIQICEEINSLELSDAVSEHWKADLLGADPIPGFSPTEFLAVLNSADMTYLASELRNGSPLDKTARAMQDVIDVTFGKLREEMSQAFAEADNRGFEAMQAMMVAFLREKSYEVVNVVIAEKGDVSGPKEFLKALDSSDATGEKMFVTDKERLKSAVLNAVDSELAERRITNDKVHRDVLRIVGAIADRESGRFLSAVTGLKDLSTFLSSVREEAADLARTLDGIMTLRADAKGEAAKQIAEKANLDEASVRDRLNSDYLDADSGKLRFLYDDVVARATNGESIDREAVLEKAQGRITTFVDGKVAILKEIDNAGFSDDVRETYVGTAFSDSSWIDPGIISVAREFAGKKSVQDAAAKVIDSLKEGNLKNLSDEKVGEAFLDLARSYREILHSAEYDERSRKWIEMLPRLENLILLFLVKQNLNVISAFGPFSKTDRLKPVETCILDRLDDEIEIREGYAAVKEVLDNDENGGWKDATERQHCLLRISDENLRASLDYSADIHTESIKKCEDLTAAARFYDSLSNWAGVYQSRS